jgi:hypothetical protein
VQELQITGHRQRHKTIQTPASCSVMETGSGFCTRIYGFKTLQSKLFLLISIVLYKLIFQKNFLSSELKQQPQDWRILEKIT